MEAPSLQKYPRTPHLETSRLQPGDHDLAQIPFAHVGGRHLVVEEKLDGANTALRFDARGQLYLQSRGHYLAGGPRERHFEQLKAWAATHQTTLFEVLGDRYILYGEWMAAKHTVFYDALPHLFFEFDILDTSTGLFLSTPARHTLLAGTPVVSVPVLYVGTLGSIGELTALLGPSLYKSPHARTRLAELARSLGQDPAVVDRETDPSPLAEGLYIKVEDDITTLERYKWVRADFVATLADEANGHWLDRPHLPNLLAEGVDLFTTAPGEPR